MELKRFEELSFLICMYDSHNYYGFIDDYFKDICSLEWEEKFELLKELYIGAKDCTEIGYFLQERVNVEEYIPKSELENINKNVNFNDRKVTVYRGINKNNLKEGCSYTLDKNKAEWFANRYGDGGYIIDKEITIDDIIFYDNSRDEKEVFLKSNIIAF